MHPAENPAVLLITSIVAVEPEACRPTAVAAFAPEPFAAAPAAGASRFMCCEPHDSAIESLPHVLKRKDTLASTVSFTWNSAIAGLPTASPEILLSDFRLKSSIHPRSTHGSGGASSANPPFIEGSNTVGVRFARSTGAKYARTRRVTGGAEFTTVRGAVLIFPSPPERQKPPP